MKTRLLFSFLTVASALLLAATSAVAAGLDPSFGEAGLSFSPPGTAAGYPSMEVDPAPDGSAIVSSGGSAVVRFGPEGAWGSAFAGSGHLSFEPDPAAAGDSEKSFRPQSTAVDSKGRLLVFGTEYDESQTAPSGSTERGGLDLTKSEAGGVSLRRRREPRPDLRRRRRLRPLQLRRQVARLCGLGELPDGQRDHGHGRLEGSPGAGGRCGGSGRRLLRQGGSGCARCGRWRG